MKGNTKKLGVFVMVVAIAMFATAAMAWDNNHDHKYGIQGHYAVTGAGHTFNSTTGFDNNYNPNPCTPPNPPFGCQVFQSVQIFSGDLIFNMDGTGSFNLVIRGIDTPPLAYSLISGGYEFIYTRTSERTFTFQVKPGTYLVAKFLAGGQTGQTVTIEVDGKCEGILSQDLQNVIVTCGPTTTPPDYISTFVDPTTGHKLPIQSILSQSVVGIRVKE